MLRSTSVVCLGAFALVCSGAACDWDRFAAPATATSPGSGGAGGQSSASTSSTSSTTGGGGGSGGAPAIPRCGGIELVAHDFEPMSDSVLQWYKGGSSGSASILDPAGTLQLTFSTTTSTPSFNTSYYYDLRGGSVAVELVLPADQTTAAATEFGVYRNSSQSVRFRLQSSTLTFEKEINGSHFAVSTIPFDAAQQRYWRLREDAGEIHWETSPDGSTWTSQESIVSTASLPVDRVRVFTRLEADGAASGSAQFDNLVSEGPTVPSWCPVAQLQDDFDDPDGNDLWWLTSSDDQIARRLFDNQLYVTLVPDRAGSSYLRRATQAYDMTGGAISIELVEPPTAPATVSLRALEGSNGLRLELVDDMLETSYDADGTRTDVNAVDFDHDAHRWWRIREDAGALHWEASPDGSSWESLGLVSPAPIELERLSIAFGAGTPEANPDPGQVIFDNFNVLP
jgi:hypothetical protein